MRHFSRLFTLVALGLAKPHPPVFMPGCSCECCTVQTCDGKATHKCLPSDKAFCMTAWKPKTEGKCKAWVDDNLVPLACNPEKVWKLFQSFGNATNSGLPVPYEGSPPAKMDHMVFCRDFCLGDGGGSVCRPGPLPKITPPTCCPCKGSDMVVPRAAPYATTLVNGTAREPPFLLQEHRKLRAAPHLGFLQKVHCSASCCH
eukprot:gnl/MRDRNA2_/MRDRNA2_105194_c0_seq1.p1 gnl/MRDRNA2_/MRDRNA2_105194_c0~~gnl/MRDRNA2_/MRDRNA2_105194_c0_seq1.p1  ORF type:complete len:201 (-),score=27.73 gnl/MRDRNA2_/MRDRNA2_105194_c0_seq1:73-675(-)